MKGRKPIPTVLAKLHRNPSNKKLNENEPIPIGVLADAPAWLTANQKEGWRYALESAPPGLLRRLDRTALTVWVVAEDIHRRAAERLDALLMRTDDNSMAFPSFYLSIINKQAVILLKAAGELGFSPAARARVYQSPNVPLPIPGVKMQPAKTANGRKVVSLAEYVASAPPRPRLLREEG